jgi:hypothetical protein
MTLGPPECKPLYLDPKVPTRVVLEGPALTILVPGQAARQLPLRRISRILVNARTEWSTAALLACAERGISLVFVDRTGEVRARLLGTPGERQELRQRLLDLLDRPDWRDLYGTWRHAQEIRAVRRVQFKLQAPPEVRTPTQTRLWLQTQARALAGPAQAEASSRWLGEPLFAWMLNHLQQLGWGAQSELGQDGWPDLVADLARIHRWYGEPIRLGWLRRRYLWAEHHAAQPLTVICRRDLMQLYQDNAAKLAQFGVELSNSLHRWAVELA